MESAGKAQLTEAPLKTTGGDCHDTLMPLSLPSPASSGHAGILTGAVAWDTGGGPRHAGGQEEEEEERRAEHNTQEFNAKTRAFWVKKKRFKSTSV